jgi:beta-lactamase class A
MCRAAEHPLVAEWRKIASQTGGVAGAAALHIPTGQRAGLNAADRFPLASVCKLPIAMQMLALVAEGKYALQQEIEIPAGDVTKSVSPIGEQWEKRKKWPLDEMLELMIAKSDNTAVQTLYRLGGGGETITARLRSWGVAGIRIDRDERTIGNYAAGRDQKPPASKPAERLAAMRRFIEDPRDTGTPDATIDLLKQALHGRILPGPLAQRLRQMLEATTTGAGRIKGLLPAGAVVGHKTGTTGDAGNLNGSTNDVGVIRLPSGADLAVAFYLKAGTAPLQARERQIARLAKAAYDWSLTAR